MAIYVFSGIVLAALFGYMIFGPTDVELDPKTLCPRGEENLSARTTVVLLDRTDPITEVQQQHILGLLSAVFGKPLPYERVVLYPLDARKDIVLEGLVLCNPRGPKKGGRIEEVSTEKEFDEKLFRDKFLNPLTDSVRKMLPSAKTTQTDSPIMEMIQAVAVSDLKPARAARLILVSDMMQYSARHSHYKATPDFKEFYRSDVFKEVSVDLTNTEVLILYITRTRGPSRQPPNHEEFWQQYFSALNARRPIVIERIRGEAWQ